MYLFGDVHRVGARLFLDNDHTTAAAVVEGFLCTFFHVVFYVRYVAQINIPAVAASYYEIEHLAGIGEFTLYTQCVGIRTDIDATARGIPVFLCDDI